MWMRRDCPERGCQTKVTSVRKKEKMMPGSKAIKNRLTLFGGNAAGDMKLKSLLLHPSENSRALPIVWKSNAKTWVTQAIFSRLVFFRTLSHFPGYYPWGTEILLGEGHPIQHSFATQQCFESPPFTDDFHPNVEVVHLPLNTLWLIQPRDQGVIGTFKKYNLCHTFHQ